MLQALDFLAWKGIVHRDVKPANILYVSQPDDHYQFQLGDFGLCNRIVDAATFAGASLYMPPEMFQEGFQTHKVDVWSLFVTMLWTLDASEFRRRSDRFKSVAEAQQAVLSAASNLDSVSKIQETAIINPEERASAAQMLLKHFDGLGLSTPRKQVSDISTSPSPAMATTKAPPPAPSSLTTRITLTKPRISAGAQYRVTKARGNHNAISIRRLSSLPTRTQLPLTDFAEQRQVKKVLTLRYS